jgi:FkbM family methyltransferase
MSKSQLQQDTRVLAYYNNKRNGFFVEIGASDGIELSNTYQLEKRYEWRGICVEPIPARYIECVNNRPNSFCTYKAVYSISGLLLDFDIAENYDLLSGIAEHIDSHKSIVDGRKTTILVPTISLNDLLDQCNAPRFIEYLSLDTEGSEYEILKTFNFNKYIFGIIDVEHNYIEPRRTDIRNLLLSHGYVYIGENKWDDSYKYCLKY